MFLTKKKQELLKDLGKLELAAEIIRETDLWIDSNDGDLKKYFLEVLSPIFKRLEK